MTSIQSPPQDLLTDEVAGLAMAAAIEEAGTEAAVGQYVGAMAEDGTAVTGYFLALLPGYAGWRWAVTLAHLSDADAPWTLSEVVLLPGPDALLAPQWVPWDQRVRHGDLGVGDLLPTTEDDVRLVPAYLLSDDPAIEELAQAETAGVAHGLGLGRVRVMSREGRAATAERWHDGTFGPGDDMAVQAPGRCATCAFYLPLAGSLGRMFGACGNEIAPADGRVVDVEYGCGAHSEAASAALWSESAATTVIDELMMDVHHRLTGADGAGADDAGADDAGADDADPVAGPPAGDDVDASNTDRLVPARQEPLPSRPDLPPVMLALEQGEQPIAALQPAPRLPAIESGARTQREDPAPAATPHEDSAGAPVALPAGVDSA